MKRLAIVPMELEDANRFVEQHHRTHAPVTGHKYSQGVTDELGVLRGVAITGRPSARALDDGWTLEVTRCATDGCENACSALYGAAWRACRALGYRRLITYTRASEPGTSLVAAGWHVVAEVRGRPWWTPSRPRVEKHTEPKLRWEAC